MIRVRPSSGRSAVISVRTAGGINSITSPIAKNAGVSVDQHDRVCVGPDFRSLSHRWLIAVGDCAAPQSSTGAPYRPSALAPAVSGAYAAEQIIASLRTVEIAPFAFSTFAQAVAIGRYGAVFPLHADDEARNPVLGGRAGRHLRAVLVWLVLHFMTVERIAPGKQSWPGRRRPAKGLPISAPREGAREKAPRFQVAGDRDHAVETTREHP